MPVSSTDERRPIGELLRTAVAEGTLLIRQELRLAAAETKPKLARAGAGLGSFWSPRSSVSLHSQRSPQR